MKKHFCTFLVWFLPLMGYGQLTFTTLSTPTSKRLLGIHFADTSIGYACGDSGLILKTINGGTTWSKLATGTLSNLWDIKVIPNSLGKKVIAVGAENTVIKSVDGGLTWQLQTIPFLAGSFVFGIQCIDSLNYFGCGGDYSTFSGAILKTKNGGLTWTKTTVPSSVFLDKIYMLDSTNGYSVGTNATFDDGSIQKYNSGSTSNVKTTSSIVTNVWCENSNKIIAIGVDGQIMKSTNGGSTWSSHSYNTMHLYGIDFINPKTGYACGGFSTVDNLILYTNDSGNTWSKIPYTFNSAFQDLHIIGNKIFIAGDSGRIIKATIPSSTNISNNISNQENAISVYPNPASGKLYIKGSENLTGATIKIFNTIGQSVLETRIDNQSFILDITQLKTGSYFYQIEKDLISISSGKLDFIAN